jgi:hypothetical protein
MAGLIPAIHVLISGLKTWMPGIKPGMTQRRGGAVRGRRY